VFPAFSGRLRLDIDPLGNPSRGRGCPQRLYRRGAPRRLRASSDHPSCRDHGARDHAMTLAAAVRRSARQLRRKRVSPRLFTSSLAGLQTLCAVLRSAELSARCLMCNPHDRQCVQSAKGSALNRTASCGVQAAVPRERALTQLLPRRRLGRERVLHAEHDLDLEPARPALPQRHITPDRRAGCVGVQLMRLVDVAASTGRRSRPSPIP
jgi:hypothetical protein